MKTTAPYRIAIGLLIAVIGTIGFKFIVLGNTEKGDDGRIAVILGQAERQAVFGEMRLLLETSQVIVEALANDDLAAVEAAATPLGSGAIAAADFTLRAKLTMEFKKLGFATHYAFDDIAGMAKEGKPVKEIQLAFASTINNCMPRDVSASRNQERKLSMTTERAVRIIAGVFVMLSIVLSSIYNGVQLTEPTWLWFTLFVGVNLFQSGITRWCLMEKILIKLGVKPGGSCGV